MELTAAKYAAQSGQCLVLTGILATVHLCCSPIHPGCCWCPRHTDLLLQTCLHVCTRPCGKHKQTRAHLLTHCSRQQRVLYAAASEHQVEQRLQLVASAANDHAGVAAAGRRHLNLPPGSNNNTNALVSMGHKHTMPWTVTLTLRHAQHHAEHKDTAALLWYVLRAAPAIQAE